VQGDVRKKVPKLSGKFDRIIMARPNLRDSFLDVAFSKIKKNGIIHYYGFYKEDKLDELKELIYHQALKAGRKIKILAVNKAGDIGIRKYRYRADVKVLS
jgi:tRNA G37 N-methylase Trm5